MRAAIIENGVVVNIVVAEPDFAAQQGWIASDTAQINDLWDGETFTPPPVPPPPVPETVTMRQARLALLSYGLLNDVDAALAKITDATKRAAAQIEWEYSQEVHRNNELVATLGPALGLDDEAIDGLFALAATL